MMNQAMEALLFAILALLLVAVAILAASWALLGGRRGWPAASAATAAAFLAAAVLLMAGSRWDAAVLWRTAGSQLTAACEMRAAQWASAGVSADRLQSLRDLCRQYVVLSFPAWLLLSCLALGMFSANLSAHLLSRTTRTVEKPAPFREWVLPEPLVFGFLLACLLKLFRPVGATDLHPQNLLANNGLVFFAGLYAIAGLGITAHFFHRWRLPFLVRLLGYAVIVNNAAEVAACFGILDVWFDFRKLKRPPPREAVP
jgi:uncharacterized protein YybS (DUF2232 family)